MKEVSGILNQPYPFSSSLRAHVVQALLFGLFIALFLILFQPFGIQLLEHPLKKLMLIGYGLVTTLTMLVNHLAFIFLFTSWYQRSTWTVGKNMLNALWMFFSIGTVNWVYSASLGFWGLSFRALLEFQLMTLLIGIFPVAVSTLMVYYSRLRKALKEAQQLNDRIHIQPVEHPVAPVFIPSQNKSEQFQLIPSDILFIRSVENYVEVHTDTKKIVVRNTLKAMEEVFSSHPEFQRCHRSYLVNLKNVGSFTGNAQGLMLHFKVAGKDIVPVSRAYVSLIKSSL
jgi:hypothetical protein